MFGFFNNDDLYKQSEIINKKLSDINNPPLLEDLLIEDGIINELQDKNEKLIKYFNKQKIKQMLDYIINEPKEEENHNKSYKFPFICCKLFNVEETKIMNYFLKTNKELIKEKNENKKNYEIFEKNGKNETKHLNLDIFQYDDDNNNEQKYKDIKDKEININDINNNKEEDNDEDNCNYKDDYNNKKQLNKDEILIKENINNNNNNNIVNQNNEKKEEEYINKDNNKNKDICLFKSPDTEIDITTENKRYELSKIKKENKNDIKTEKENKDKENNNNSNNKGEIDDKYPEDKIEILDYFLSFLINDGELNYVLCGYFSSIMLNLLNNNSTKIIQYLFLQRKDILKRLVYHSYRKSIAEILCKLIKYEEYFHEKNNDEENRGDYDEKEFSLIRLNIIKDIFNKIDINMDTEKLFSLSFIINDLAENKNIFESILNNKNIIQNFINNQLKDINLNIINKDKENENNKKNNFIIIIDMVINWLNNIEKKDIQIPMLLYEVDDDFDDDNDLVQQKENEDIQPELHHTLLSRALFETVPNLIKNNFNKLDNNNNNEYILQSYNDYKLKPLGLYKIKIVQILTSLISYCKNIPNEYDDLLINSNFFENAINYIFEYEWNNLYQESLFQFLNKLFTYEKDYPYHEKSAEYLLTKINLLNKIILNLKNIKNNETEGNTGRGYTAFLISLSYKINTIIGGNYLDLNKSYTKEGSITFMNRGENVNNKDMNILYNFGKDKNNAKNNKEKKEEIKPINCMKKYCNEEWNYFFKDNISNKIKIYEDKLYDKKNNLDDSRDDLFVNDFEYDNINNNNETEDLLGKYKSRDEELFEDNNKYDDNEDLFNNDINDIKDMAKFKDMEINLNDFNFINNSQKQENDNEKDKNENENKYNSVNYWKNSLEKENNSYLNNLGEEALKDLLD